ncbi:MAG TPA: hypothetical protein VNW96_19215 [Mycobacterium sp.]|jgi:hypothetical protein|nr:hypothetical protein [Mycobacterium sp.]
MPSSIASGGITEQSLLLRLRADLQDPPLPYKETWTGDGVTTNLRVQQWPIYDANSGDYPLTVTVAGVAATPKGARSLLSASTDVFVEYDTGWLYFQTAPANAASVVCQHYRVLFTDARLLNAVNEGLRQLCPHLMRWTNYTFQLAVNQWEYALPLPDFQSPYTRIVKVEVQEIPAATEPFFVEARWRRVALNTIKIHESQWFTPGATCRVQYWTPYQAISDVDPQNQDLPLLYAKGRLMIDKEMIRARFDQAQAQGQAEQNNPPGASANAGMTILQEFRQQVQERKRIIPMAGSVSTWRN